MYSTFLLSLLVASAVGWPWHDDIEKSQTLANSMSHMIPFCKSAINSSASSLLQTYLQVCRDDSDPVVFCYFSTIGKCCQSPINDAIEVHSRNDVHFGNATVSTAILKVKQGGCAHFFDKHANIKICKTTQNCFPGKGCLTPERVCRINTVEGTTCTADNGCTCKPGYAAPDCCKCDTENDYFNATDGSCQKICASQCLIPTLNDGCAVCRPRYQEPTCCDCKSGFVENNVGKCVCPPGTVDVNGNCNPVCINDALVCGQQSCTCKPGYAPPDCCNCTFDITGAYFKRNGKCDEICTEHANKEDCNAISGCSQCEDGFKPPDCCKCPEPKKLVDGVCQDCEEDEEKIDGICTHVCRENIEQCNGDSCTCKPGYKPDDCCCPIGQKLDDNEICICTTTQKPPVDGVCPVPCIDHQDIIFLFDTSFGNDYSSLWSAAYFLEILSATLLQNTVDLNIYVIPVVNSSSQQEVKNLVPEWERPFTKNQCQKVALSIENSVYINLSPNTYSDLTLLLLNDLLVDKRRPTTISTLAGSPSNTANGNIENIVANIHQSISEIASGRELPVKYFAVNFINKDNVLKEDYKKELIALAGDNEGRYVTGSNWMNDFTSLLRTEGVLCDKKRNSVIRDIDNTELFDKYLRCLRKKRSDSTHKCVELDEYSPFCTTSSKASIESKLVDALQELLGRLN